MLEDDIIIHSKSAWNSPLKLVPKKDAEDGSKRFRVVIDFRKLNTHTLGDAFPLPTIAPPTFQRIMNYALTSLQGLICFVYCGIQDTTERDFPTSF